MDNCIFCKIIKGEIPCKKIYENDTIFAFDDINPVAPVHVLVVPKAHIPTIMDVKEKQIMDELLFAVQEVAKIKGIDEKGFRTLINCNKDGGQVIYHLHAHVIGGGKIDTSKI
ncbi:MAG: histidine triad nucleotide-binding protein [Deltaproteobacteria bacterium]